MNYICLKKEGSNVFSVTTMLNYGFWCGWRNKRNKRNKRGKRNEKVGYLVHGESAYKIGDIVKVKGEDGIEREIKIVSLAEEQLRFED